MPCAKRGAAQPDAFKDGREITLSEQENHGKDYWQADYDPVHRTWDITYSVPLAPDKYK